jgi:hypothetical protein
MTIRIQGHPPLELQVQKLHPGVVLPMSYFGAHNSPFDPNPADHDLLTIDDGAVADWMNGKLGYIPGTSGAGAPDGADLRIDLELPKWCLPDEKRKPRQIIVDVLCEIVNTVHRVKPSVKCGVYNRPETNGESSAVLCPEAQSELDEMQQACQPVNNLCDYIIPEFYVADATRPMSVVVEWATKTLERIRRFHPYAEIRPIVCPVCYQNAIVTVVGGPDWERLLSVFPAFGITDIQVWFEQRWLHLWDEAADWWEVTLELFGK